MKWLLSIALVLVLAGCGGGGDTATTEQAATPPPTGGCSDAKSSADDRTLSNEHKKLEADKTYRLVFETNCGDFTVTLDQKQSPNATGSLVSLAERRFFDGTSFHRIVPDFVIQGGDPTGTGTGGPGYSTHDKVPSTAKYSHGVVAMAKSARRARRHGRAASSSS